MAAIKRFLAFVWKLEALAITALLGLMVTITFIAVVNRNTVAYPMPWTEEIVRFMFLWCIMIAASKGVRENAHIGINVFTAVLPKKAQAYLNLFVIGLAILVCVLLVRVGYIQTQNNIRQLSPSLGINMGFVYSGVAVGGGLMVVSWLSVFATAIKNLRQPK